MSRYVVLSEFQMEQKKTQDDLRLCCSGARIELLNTKKETCPSSYDTDPLKAAIIFTYDGGWWAFRYFAAFCQIISSKRTDVDKLFLASDAGLSAFRVFATLSGIVSSKKM